MLPEPALTLTLPSLHDGTPLDCRVYHPSSLSASGEGEWEKSAAVFAHPYGPMGGSFDDHVVGEIASVALRRGCVVATFNFRGSGGSAGRTSWSARPERDDFMSIVGFMAYYLHYLDPFREMNDTNVGQTTFSPSQSLLQPRLIVGGYSYGSIVATTLSPLDDILSRFATPEVDSFAAQIRLRAEELAVQENTILRSAKEMMRERSARKGAGSLRVGDASSSPKRKSLDGLHRRSFSIDDEKIRKSVDKVFRRGKQQQQHQDTAIVEEAIEEESTRLAAVDNFVLPREAYLFVSPIQGMTLHLAVLGSWLSRASKTQSVEIAKAEEKLVRNPTLAVYGDSDGFVAAHKLRSWCERLRRRDSSKFRSTEVRGGGHFWIEEGVMVTMKEQVDGFLAEIL